MIHSLQSTRFNVYWHLKGFLGQSIYINLLTVHSFAAGPLVIFKHDNLFLGNTTVIEMYKTFLYAVGFFIETCGMLLYLYLWP